MSAILDLDQIACSGNGVVSDKRVLPALTHLAGSLQQWVLVQIRGEVGGLLYGFPQRRGQQLALGREKLVGVFPSLLVTTFRRRLRLFAFLSLGSCWCGVNICSKCVCVCVRVRACVRARLQVTQCPCVLSAQPKHAQGAVVHFNVMI